MKKAQDMKIILGFVFISFLLSFVLSNLYESYQQAKNKAVTSKQE